MSDALQQAILAINTGNNARGKQLLGKVLQADPSNDLAWVWMSRAVATGEQRRACLDRALTINPNSAEAQQAILDWLMVETAPPARPPPTGQQTPPSAATLSPPAHPLPPTAQEIRPQPGTSLKDFLLQLTKNYNILQEREAKYGSTAAPLDLLNQLDDYAHAISLTQEAINRSAPLDELQDEFNSLNLQISTVVFVAQEPSRKPFKGLNPYRGLRKFTENDAEFFFGRNAAIQSLLNTAQYLVNTGTGPQIPNLMAVLGPSGSGKSSLVRAGLIPALRNGSIPNSNRWPIKVILPGAHPLDALAAAFAGNANRNQPQIKKALHADKKTLHRLTGEVLANQPEDAFLVLVIDQFEELFTVCENEPERRAFTDQLLFATQVKDSRILVVLTMRSDFYSKVAVYKPLAEAVTRHQMLVSPMTEKELREAILLPAEAVGLEVEKALVETLLKDTFEAPGVLPLLQHALLELFQRRDGNLLTLEAYNEIGGVKGALAHRADAVINSLTPDRQQIARRIFMRLIRLGEGTADTRRRAAFTEVLTHDSETPDVEAVIKTLADANLLITGSSPDSGEVILDVSHEALIQEWPLLRHWMDEDRQGLRIRHQLSQAARDWQDREQDEDSLYRGARLLEVEEWVSDNPDEINPLEQTFLAASIEARQREAAEEEAQRRRELAQAQALAKEQQQRAEEQARAAANLRKRAVWIAGVGAVAILLAIAAAGFGVSSSRNANLAATREAEAQANANLAATRAAEAREAQTEAERQAGIAAARETEARQAQSEAERQANIAATREAEARQAQSEAEQQARRALAGQLAAQSRTGLDHQFDLALLAGLAAYDLLQSSRITDTFEAESSILATVTRFPRLEKFLQGHSAPVWALAVSPDGTTLATGNDANQVMLWDLAGGQLIGPLGSHKGVVTDVAFSPDGKTLASSSSDKTIILWDVSTRKQRRQLKGHDDWVNSVAFSPNGNLLASASTDTTVRLWDVASGQQVGDPLAGHSDAVVSVEFSPNGQTLASGSNDTTIILWDVSAREVRTELFGYDEAVLSVAFNPAGNLLASGGLGHTIILWDTTTGQQVGPPLAGHTDYVLNVVFSPNGQTLASTSADGTFILWDVNTREPRYPPFSGHGSDVTRVIFGPNGRFLVSTSDDGSIILWDTSGRLPTGTPVSTDYGPVNSVAYSPNGKTLAAGYEDGSITLFDAGQLTQRRRLSGHTNWVTGLAFSPNGQILASASGDESVILWDMATGEQIGESLKGHTGPVLAVAFSPDGQTLATAGQDKRIILWDVAAQESRLELVGHEDTVETIAFSPDGKILASGSADNTIILWDVSGGKPLGDPLEGHTNVVAAVAFSPNGRLLASASEDSTIRLWDVATQKPIAGPLRGHNNDVFSVAFSPDGRFLASASLDQTVRLWDVAGRRPLGDPLLGHGAAVDGLVFSPNGKTVASGGRDGAIILWDVDFQAWRATACRRANRDITAEEWARLVGPDVPYRPVCPNLPGAVSPASASG